MLRLWKKNIWFLVFTICAGLVGGYALGIWKYGQMDTAMQEQMQAQGMNQTLAALSTALQSGFLYGGLLCILGMWLSNRVGLWRPVTFHAKKILLAVLFGCMVGLLLFPLDGLVFGPWTELAAWSHLQPASLAQWTGSVLYGGVIEEILVRLFLLSLIALVLKRLFARKSSTLPSWVGWTANLGAALLFAAGHLPATAAMVPLTPMVLLRCFVLNGTGGLVFGWLYEKEGIQYAMTAHAMAHIFSQLLIWIWL